MTNNAPDVSVLAIIPARSGSKGLPGKNIINCAGKPLIAWSIDAALGSKYVTKVLVTTDSDKIADVASEYGGWVPFLRETDLAKDDSSITDVVKDVLSNIKGKAKYDLVILLQPTSPLRTSKHIDNAIDMFLKGKNSGSDALVSVYKIDSKCLLAFGINKNSNNIYSHFGIDLTNPRRQDLPQTYAPNGSIYISSIDGFDGFYSENTMPFIMNENVSIDIDYKCDLEKAIELLSGKINLDIV